MKKKCNICFEIKAFEKFDKKKQNKDGYERYCKECRKKHYSHKHYLKNKSVYIERAQKRRKEISTWWFEQKSKLKFKCSKCKENRWWCLDFHHEDPTKKDFNLSYKNVCGKGREKVLEEIDKCIILCANCHRDLHYQQRIIAHEQAN